MRSLLGSVLALFGLVSPSFAFLPQAYDDAPLRAVQFVDKNQGVAVGDHGVVWMTLNGGKTWDRMKSGTKSSLRSVCFIDPFHGWAVGRTELSGEVGSAGTVLATVDGGLTWTEVAVTHLPGLNVVKFFDEKMGITAGDGTPSYPSGLFATDDGGKTWQPISGQRTTSWTCAHFSNLSNGVLGGVGSNLKMYQKGQQQIAAADLSDGRSVRGFAFDKNHGVAVGDGGLILTTTFAGGGWGGPSTTGLSAEAAACVDFECVTRAGRTVWAAGRPGSVVLKSTDEGVKWSVCKTGWNLPLHAICAASETDVWAVGELGAILKSADGGQTWAVQQCGGQRAAVLFAHADGRNVPVDAVAAVGGRDGYFTVGMSVTCDEKRLLDSFRLSAAMRAAGGAAGESSWAFPMSSHLSDSDPNTLLAEWNKRHSVKAKDALVRQLVLAMRIWSPDVVVSDVLSNATGPAEQLVLSAVQQAFKTADDPTVYPEQIEVLGLKAVAPKKLYAVAPEPSADSPVKMDHTAFAKTLINTVQGYAEPACAILGERAYPPNSRSFRLVSHRMPGCDKHAELMQGLDLAEGGSARRKLPQFDPAVDEHFKTMKVESTMDTRRKLDGMIRSANTTIGLERAMTLAADTLRKMPEDVACRTAVGLGRQLASQGQWVAARELFLMAAAKYDSFPESAEAIRWLSRYYASAEARMRADKSSLVVMQYGGPANDGLKQASASESVRLTDGEATQAWCRACLEMEGKLKAFGPAYTRTPSAILTALAARRQLGLTNDAAKAVGECFADAAVAKAMKPGTDLWRDCLAAEHWLQDRNSIPTQPKPLALCPKVANKPYLDGKLNDDCWKKLKPIEVKTAAGELTGYGTKAYFVFDDDYLYFAVECTHPEGKALSKAEARRRDDDLRGKDRVDILLDVDRDYQSYFRLQVDQRGCVAEDCWGDTSWNPKWFVAVEPSPTGWTVEIAIPRSELCVGAFKSNSVWGMNVTRVVPNLGCQTWSGPAESTPRPEGMGLMQFHNEKK